MGIDTNVLTALSEVITHFDDDLTKMWHHVQSFGTCSIIWYNVFLLRVLKQFLYGMLYLLSKGSSISKSRKQMETFDNK